MINCERQSSYEHGIDSEDHSVLPERAFGGPPGSAPSPLSRALALRNLREAVDHALEDVPLLSLEALGPWFYTLRR